MYKMCSKSDIEFLLLSSCYNNVIIIWKKKMYTKKYYNYEIPSTFKLIQLLPTENATDLYNLS
jgi:hypothetical protein